MAVKFFMAWEVHKITAMREGRIWRTARIGYVWVRRQGEMTNTQIAQEFGGDMLVVVTTSDPRIHETRPREGEWVWEDGVKRNE